MPISANVSTAPFFKPHRHFCKSAPRPRKCAVKKQSPGQKPTTACKSQGSFFTVAPPCFFHMLRVMASAHRRFPRNCSFSRSSALTSRSSALTFAKFEHQQYNKILQITTALHSALRCAVLYCSPHPLRRKVATLTPNRTTVQSKCLRLVSQKRRLANLGKKLETCWRFHSLLEPRLSTVRISLRVAPIKMTNYLPPRLPFLWLLFRHCCGPALTPRNNVSRKSRRKVMQKLVRWTPRGASRMLYCMHCAAQHCTALYRMYCTVMHCAVLYCTVL